MEIKDIAGLSEPLKKLIEVVSDGIGAVARSWLIRKDAKALAEANKLLADGGLTVGAAELEGLSAQIAARVNYQEVKRQRNLGRIVEAAQKALPEKVSGTAVDPDWTSRFFSAAQEISNEEMQQLWGRLLAGEIAAPGSFSLRALDCLRNMTSAEARIFSEVCDFAISDLSLPAFLISPYPPDNAGAIGVSMLRTVTQQVHKIREAYEKREINYDKLIFLSELNLINFTRGEECVFKSESSDRFFITVRVGARYLTIENDDQKANLVVPSMSFTSLGCELFKLHMPGANPEFEVTLVDVFQTSGFQAHWTAHPPPKNTGG